MVSTHRDWDYNLAHDTYYGYPGIVPGCNEASDGGDLNSARRVMWGLMFGGGTPYIENIVAANGSVVTNEIYRFLNPQSDAPAFWTMKPERGLIPGNNGSKYVLAGAGASEVLVFIDHEPRILGDN